MRHADLQYRNPYSVARTVLLMSRWFRHYGGLARDEKLVSVAVKSRQSVERVVWVWSAILESASEINDNGRYEFDTAEAAYFLRCDDAELGSILTCMESLGRLCDGVVARWGDRQYSSDSAAERQRRYRERKSGKAAIYEDDRNDKRDSDVTVTSHSVTVTAQDTDTDTDTEIATNVAIAPQAAKPKTRGTRLTENWVLPKSYGDWALSQGLPRERILIEANKMRDWSINAGKNGVKKDWMAAWRNWVQGAIDALPRGSPSKAEKPRNIAEASVRLLEQMREAQNANTQSGPAGSLTDQDVRRIAAPNG